LLLNPTVPACLLASFAKKKLSENAAPARTGDSSSILLRASRTTPKILLYLPRVVVYSFPSSHVSLLSSAQAKKNHPRLVEVRSALTRVRRIDMSLVPLVIQLISGAVGGNIAGAILKKFDLGPIGNSIAGLVGGGIGGQLLSMLMSNGAASSAMSAATSAAGSGLDMSSILASVGGGGVGGAVVMAIVGLIKGQMAKS
jgi:hypothetical protein